MKKIFAVSIIILASAFASSVHAAACAFSHQALWKATYCTEICRFKGIKADTQNDFRYTDSIEYSFMVEYYMIVGYTPFGGPIWAWVPIKKGYANYYKLKGGSCIYEAHRFGN